MHSMSDADMARWVEDWYAAHPARGQRSADVAADTFLVSNYHFDSDGDPSGTPVDTVRIDVGQTVMWKWVQGNHTTTNGTFGDPSLGLLWDQPMDAAHLEFSFRFDSTGVYNFICRPHAFQGMTGVVVVSGAGGVDVNPPQVTVYTPNGFDQLPAQQPTDISWLAIDDVGVTSVDLFYRDADGAPWVTLARDLPNSGHFTWNVPNVPTTQARVRVVARDAAGNVGADSSDDVFEIQRVAGGRVATTARLRAARHTALGRRHVLRQRCVLHLPRGLQARRRAGRVEGHDDESGRTRSAVLRLPRRGRAGRPQLGRPVHPLSLAGGMALGP